MRDSLGPSWASPVHLRILLRCATFSRTTRLGSRLVGANLRFVQSGPHGPIVELSVHVGLRPPLTRDFFMPPLSATSAPSKRCSKRRPLRIIWTDSFERRMRERKEPGRRGGSNDSKGSDAFLKIVGDGAEVAERERFELSRDVTPCTLSKGVVSATHPSLRGKNSVGCRLPKLGPPCKTYFQGPGLPETDGCQRSSAPVDLAP